jgi:hypothetical protein
LHAKVSAIYGWRELVAPGGSMSTETVPQVRIVRPISTPAEFYKAIMARKIIRSAMLL